MPDTLIVWTETNGTDMALSFQEADGCTAIWLVLITCSCRSHGVLSRADQVGDTGISSVMYNNN